MLVKIYYSMKILGLFGFISAVYRRLASVKAKCFNSVKDLLVDKAGLEVGGPSNNFSDKGMLPIYSVVRSLDNCNFGNKTMWEGTLVQGQKFVFSPTQKAGYQYVCESSYLKDITDAKYDFLLSHHALEHMANPIKVLMEWVRVLKNKGILVLVLPHKSTTFDRHRPVTKLSHLIEDYRDNVGEDDRTHMQEILDLHDLKRDPYAGSKADFKKRTENNFENRGMHHHVFDNQLVIDLLDHVGLQFELLENHAHNHIIVVGRKLPLDLVKDNNASNKVVPEFVHGYLLK